MKKVLVCIFVGLIILLSISCGVTENKNFSREKDADNNLETRIIKKVVFSNYYRGWESENAIVRGYNEIINDYENVQNAENEDTLYAFVIILNTYEGWSELLPTNPSSYPKDSENESPKKKTMQRYLYSIEKAKSILKNNGFYLLSEYPYSSHTPYKEDAYGNLIRNDVDFNYGLCAFAGTLKDISRVFSAEEPFDGWYCRVVSAVRPDFEEYVREAGWEDEEFSVWYSENREEVESLMNNVNQVTMSVEIEK